MLVVYFPEGLIRYYFNEKRFNSKYFFGFVLLILNQEPEIEIELYW